MKVGSIVHALAILRHLAESGTEKGVTAIASSVAISPSSCFNILKTLVSEQVVDFDRVSKHYRLGPGLFELTRGSLERPTVLDAIAPSMQMLADKHHVAIGLWRIGYGEHALLVELAEHTATTRIHLTIGQQVPPLAGSVGRIVAAHMKYPMAQLKTLLRAIRWQATMSPEDYCEQVEQARRLGYAVDVDTFIRGVTSVATAIPDRRGHVRFCVTATTFSGQFSETELAVVGESLHRLAGTVAETVYGVTGAMSPP